MQKFQRIYWLGAFDWKAYAKLYDAYCRSPENYYQEGAKELFKAVEIPKRAHILDAGAGTGALTYELLKRKPDVSITAIDLSKEMLHYYKKHFTKRIKIGQIKVIRGNAEQVHLLIKKPVDIIFVASALWDMELLTFFKNARNVLAPGGKIVFNLPVLVLGEVKGFIGFIEKSVRAELPGKQLYRRILARQLARTFKKYNYRLVKIKHYSFILSKNNISRFFKVLRYRYPFILFPKELSYEKRLQLCTQIFKIALEKLPKKGVKEEGKIFVVEKI